jgi:hypothetical protein
MYDEGYLLWLLKVSSSSALLFSSRTYKDAARKTCNTKPCDTRIRKGSTTYARLGKASRCHAIGRRSVT